MSISKLTLLKLDKWYQAFSRTLPWRKPAVGTEQRMYEVWISEIMLQQTQVITVIDYYNTFMKTFPTVQDLAEASEERVLKKFAGLGYYSRARNLHKTAKIVAEKGFPNTVEGLLELPGIGPYTANAIRSIACNQAVGIVDTNIIRVFIRFFGLKNDSLESTKKDIWKMVHAIVQAAAQYEIEPSLLNQAWMELGATVCFPKEPKCPQCPIKVKCYAFRENAIDQYTVSKKRKQPVIYLEYKACYVNSNQEVFLTKTQIKKWRASLWDLPDYSGGHTDLQSFQVITKHVVTHHRITRYTKVLQTVPPFQLEGDWFSVKDYPAMGVAAKKTLQRVHDWVCQNFK